MPITDYIDERCPLCRWYLTDLDGLWECQEGCGSHQYEGDYVVAPENPFEGQLEMQKEFEGVYTSEGKKILPISQALKRMDWMF